jgi:membrane-associated protease RseP (regulator of RpoE activity)
MSFWFGVLIFALGIFVSVCLHEAGHLLTAKRFGMKATQYFAGFGPTIWSFRRGETEYGVKAFPAGGFVKIIGMTPLEDVPAADSHRAFWRFPLYQRTVVLVAGSATHFALAAVIFFFAAFTTGLPNPANASYDPLTAEPVIGQVSACVVQDYDLTKDGNLRACRDTDPVGPAKEAGLRSGDRIVTFDGKQITNYGDLVRTIRATPAGPVDVTYVRDGERRSTTATLVSTTRPALTDEEGTGEQQTVSAIGLSAARPDSTLHYTVLEAVPASIWYVGVTVDLTFEAIAKFPSKIPKLIDAIGGEQRDPETPISVVGASRVGGEAVELGLPIVFLALLGGLNVFVGVFNLFPLLPLDGGHVAIAWYERARSWLAARRGLPDPGRVDYNKLLPLTYAVLLIFGGLTLLTLTADVVNPISLR